MNGRRWPRAAVHDMRSKRPLGKSGSRWEWRLTSEVANSHYRILLKNSKLHSPEFLRRRTEIDNSLRESSQRLLERSWLRATEDRPVPTSEKERRLYGPGIFRVAPEKEFFNSIG